MKYLLKYKLIGNSTYFYCSHIATDSLFYGDLEDIPIIFLSLPYIKGVIYRNKIALENVKTLWQYKIEIQE